MADDTDTLQDQTEEPQVEGAPEEEPKEPLKLDVNVEEAGACQRHVTVTVPREDIERYFNEAFSELMTTAQVPGFRQGRAPRKLVESRFRKDVKDQVKGNLLMDSMAQVTEEHKLAAISEPDIDPVAVELPDEGPFTFEFDIEVRPDFELPEWKGLKIERPTHEFTEEEVDEALNNLLSEHGRLVPKDDPAETGDYVACSLTFKHGDKVLSRSGEEVIRVRPVLSFRDCRIEGFDKLMKGAKAGDTRETQVELSQDAPNEELRGEKVDAVFDVQDVKRLDLPELNKDFLDRIGGFESEEELREAVRSSLERQLQYRQQQRVREQITEALTESADWELPPELLKRQSHRELERAVLELRRSGFSEDEIRAHMNELRQDSRATTARALKEHFILERLAEENDITDTEADYDQEIMFIAMQSGESPRRVRARIEKQGLMDALRNQIIERKAIELIRSEADFKEVPYKPEALQTAAVDRTVGGGEEDENIPRAQHEEGEAKPLPEHPDHT